jgi:hypothetical protein
MWKIKENEKSMNITKQIANLQAEGGTWSSKFYMRIRSMLWDKKEQSIKVRIRKGVNGETITIMDPKEVREYIQEAWTGHFKTTLTMPTTTV